MGKYLKHMGIYAMYEMMKNFNDVGLPSDKTPPKDYGMNKNKLLKRKENERKRTI